MRKTIWAIASADGKRDWVLPGPITAMAHKLARMIWHIIRFNQPYDPAIWAAAEEKLKKKKLHRLAQTAATLGYKLTCAPTTQTPSALLT
jgi:hypothetical protein